MSSGFNTDVEVGGRVFHVQTEDRGLNPKIDTAVYHNGRVLHRRACDYQHFVDSLEFTPEGLRERVEEQHRCVIEDLRGGFLDAEIAAAIEQAGIEVHLLNPRSWLSGGHVLLELEILRRGDRQPEPGVLVEAAIEGAARDDPHRGKSDERGRVQLQFPLPMLGRDDLTLVIQARNDSSKDEIRFAMRAKPKNPPAGAAP